MPPKNPAAVKPVDQGAVRGRGSGSFGCGVTAGESPRLLLTQGRFWCRKLFFTVGCQAEVVMFQEHVMAIACEC